MKYYINFYIILPNIVLHFLIDSFFINVSVDNKQFFFYFFLFSKKVLNDHSNGIDGISENSTGN